MAGTSPFVLHGALSSSRCAAAGAPASIVHEVWSSLRASKSTKLVQADAIASSLKTYQRLVDVGFPAELGHASRQHELAAFIRKASAFLVVPAGSPTGISDRTRKSLLGAARKCGGILRDDFGVYDGEDRVVFGAWVKKLAPMPS